MIISLSLKNFALIDQASISFEKGFHVLTGETGAGKTLLVQAIHLLTGKKVSTDLIRKGAEKAVLEATFDIEKLQAVHSLLVASGIEHDPQELLIIKREVMATSKNRIFINSQQASLSLLAQLGPHLLSLVGQNRSLALREQEEQRNLIDTFAGISEKVAAFGLAYEEERQLEAELDQLMRETPEHLLEKLKWERDEWSQLQYQEGEEEALFEEYKKLSSFQENSNKFRLIQEGLDHPSLLSTLNQCQKHADGELADHINGAIVHLQEASYLVSKKLDEIEFHPERFEELEKRLSTLNSLKKKYHIESSKIPSHVQEIEVKIEELENIDERGAQLKVTLGRKKDANRLLALSLTQLRKEAATSLCERLASVLHELNMPHAKVEVRIEPKEMGPKGCDQVSIFLAANQGESPASLQSKSSGGELSRVLFAATLLLAEKASLPTLIFDEIDSNVGGETARVVGEKLKALGISTQVLVITHFPQVARFADHHFQILKVEREGRTVTEIHPLEESSREGELLRMMGGVIQNA